LWRTARARSYRFIRCLGQVQYADEVYEIQEREPVTMVRVWNDSVARLLIRHAEVRGIRVPLRVSAGSGRPGYPHAGVAVAETPEQFPAFLQKDAPRHQYYRRVVGAEFTGKAVATRRAEAVEIVDDALDGLLEMPDYLSDLVRAGPGARRRPVEQARSEAHARRRAHARAGSGHRATASGHDTIADESIMQNATNIG
jgi:hypothetical protein